jgi:Rrf2 family protein
MNFTAKSRYALKIMMALCKQEEIGLQTRIEVSKRHGIPLEFMDQILARLKSAELIQTNRGRSGGISLTKLPSSVTLWEIFKAVEDNLYPVQCLENEGCVFENDCISKNVWVDIFSGIELHLQNITLDRAMERAAPNIGLTRMDHIQECKAPKKQIQDSFV